ncbi:MAG: LLM class F420-dependent oxidoreductase [Acidimicrobiales bacterium]|nr:LLM class F420-dependent oxidoreductase [Acidimicrobiales bacterium]
MALDSLRIGIHLPQYGRVAGPDAIVRAAQYAERLGFADVWVSDHTVRPAAQRYPSAHLYDPLVTLAWAGAVTERVGLGTSVLVVPSHEPVSLANRLASIDALSGGRLTIGVGVGWSEAEYRAVGQEFSNRGRRLDEAIDLFRAVWTDDPTDFDGEFSQLEDMRVLPKPAHRIPIWVGGGSEAAYRRGVTRGDGFQVIGVTPEEAAPVVARLREERPEPGFTMSLRTGWDPQGMDAGVIREERAAYAEAGIQHVVCAPWRSDLEDWLRSMDLLAEIVLH